MADMYCTF